MKGMLLFCNLPHIFSLAMYLQILSLMIGNFALYHKANKFSTCLYTRLVYYWGLYSYNVLYNFHHSQLPFLVLACALKSTTWYFLFIMKVQIKSWNYHKIKIFQELWLYSGIFKMFIEYSRLVTKLLNIKKSWTVKTQK